MGYLDTALNNRHGPSLTFCSLHCRPAAALQIAVWPTDLPYAANGSYSWSAHGRYATTGLGDPDAVSGHIFKASSFERAWIFLFHGKAFLGWSLLARSENLFLCSS